AARAPVLVCSVPRMQHIELTIVLPAAAIDTAAMARQPTPAARDLFARLRRELLDHDEPDEEKLELMRDEVIEQPSIVYPLHSFVDERLQKFGPLMVASVLALDVVVHHGEDDNIREAGLHVVVQMLIRGGENVGAIVDGSLLHHHLAE